MPPLPPDQHRFRLQNAAAALLRNLSKETPQLILLNDLQWADGPSIQLLSFLIRNVVHADKDLGNAGLKGRVLLICNVREEETEPNDALAEAMRDLRKRNLVQTVRLERLSEEEVVRMIGSMLGQKETPGLLGRRIHQESEGIPYFVEEIVKSLVEGGLLQWEGGRWKLQGDAERKLTDSSLIEKGLVELPLSIRDALGARIERLSEEAREVLRAAALIGKEFEFDILLRAGGKEEEGLLDLIDEFIKKRIVCESARQGDWFHFYHDLLRQVVQQGWMERRKRRLHGKIAEALLAHYAGESEAHCERIAEHYYQAGMLSQALPYLQTALAKAVRGYDHGAGLLLANRIEEALTDLPDEPLKTGELSRMLLQRIRIHDVTAKRNEQRRDIDRLHELAARAKNERLLAQAYNEEATLLILTGEYARGESTAEETLKLHQRLNDPRGIAHAFKHQGNLGYCRSDYAAAIERFKQALQLYRQTKEPSEEASILNNLGLSCQHQNRFPEALRYYRQGLGVYASLGDRRGRAQVLGNMGIVHKGMGQYEVALENYQEVLGIFGEIGDRRGIGYTLGNIGIVHIGLGDWKQARDRLDQAMELFKETGNKMGEGLGLNLLGLVEAAHEQWDAAREKQYQALGLAESMNYKLLVARVRNALSIIYLESKKDGLNALQSAREALRLAQEASLVQDACRALCNVSRAHLLLGQKQEALAAAEEAAGMLKGGIPIEDPEEIHLRLALALEATGKSEEAIQARREGRRLLEDKTNAMKDAVRKETFLKKPTARELLFSIAL
jgi:tetratricopeptide (TPR) repeat protein